MQTTRPRKRSPLLLLACSLIAAGSAFCSSDSKSAPEPTAAPSKPSLTPTGPELILQPSAAQSLHAVAPGATRFEWTLNGEGTLSPRNGETALYTAPDHNGAMALVSVVAYNRDLASPQSSISISTAAPPAVQLDALGIPAGWMAEKNHDPSTVIHVSASPKGCHTGADCVRMQYRPGASWAGIVWWPESCGSEGTQAAWNQARACSCAIDVLSAGNLHTVSRISFWARGERGGEVLKFKVGDDTLCPKPGRSSRLLTLTADWKRYEIDLAGLDMKRAVGLFIWVADRLHNPDGATFDLDDVQFEGTR